MAGWGKGVRLILMTNIAHLMSYFIHNGGRSSRGNATSKIVSPTQKYSHAKKKGFTVVLPRLVEKWRFGADVSN